METDDALVMWGALVTYFMAYGDTSTFNFELMLSVFRCWIVDGVTPCSGSDSTWHGAGRGVGGYNITHPLRGILLCGILGESDKMW